MYLGFCEYACTSTASRPAKDQEPISCYQLLAYYALIPTLSSYLVLYQLQLILRVLILLFLIDGFIIFLNNPDASIDIYRCVFNNWDASKNLWLSYSAYVFLSSFKVINLEPNLFWRPFEFY